MTTVEFLITGAGLAGLVVAAMMYIASKRSDETIESLNTTIDRSELFSKLDGLIELYVEIQFAFHPDTLAWLKLDEEEKLKFIKKYEKQFSAAEEAREIVVSRDDLDRASVKLIEALIDDGVEYCQHILKSMPQSIRTSALRPEIRKVKAEQWVSPFSRKAE